MNPTLEDIKPETLSLIESQAKYLGISVDEYLRRLLPATEPLGLKSEATDDDFERDIADFADPAQPSPQLLLSSLPSLTSHLSPPFPKQSYLISSSFPL